jgi:hypothetical protein
MLPPPPASPCIRAATLPALAATETVVLLGEKTLAGVVGAYEGGEDPRIAELAAASWSPHAGSVGVRLAPGVLAGSTAAAAAAAAEAASMPLMERLRGAASGATPTLLSRLWLRGCTGGVPAVAGLGVAAPAGDIRGEAGGAAGGIWSLNSLEVEGSDHDMEGRGPRLLGVPPNVVLGGGGTRPVLLREV